MNIARMFGLLLISALFLVSIASAADTRLNITMSETVDQNTTFAYNFDLVEGTPGSGAYPLDYCEITGVVNISNPNSETVSDIYLEFFNGSQMTSNFTLIVGSRNGTQSNGSAGLDDYLTLHIVELRLNQWAAFNYTFDCDTIAPPLNVSTTYSNAEFGITTKVLAGHNWTVNQTAQNDLSVAQNIRNINITINAQNVIWNVSGIDNFTLVYLYPEGDSGNVTNVTDMSWWWEVNGGTLPQGASNHIAYQVRAPDNVPTSASYLALKETLEYEVWYLASNLSITSITAVADFNMELDKRIIQPASNANDTNVTWEVSVNLSVPFNISYNLTKVSVWVTESLLLNETSNYNSQNLSINYTPNKEINQTVEWYLGSAGDNISWKFNFSDASTNPPIVWLRPYFTIMSAYNQIVQSSMTVDGTDIYMKYIYVVNGYWLQIDKNITSIDDDTYKIQSIVKNIGTAWTPNNTVVTVYDFIPAEFTVWNMNPTNDSSSPVTGGGFNGTAYRWTIPLKNPYSASLGPQYGPLAETYANYSWNVTYYVNGSGQYKVSELYIVGLDPRKVDGAGTHEGVTVVSGLESSNKEIFYIAVVFFLVIINIINFVMTRRINDKLNHHKK